MQKKITAILLMATLIFGGCNTDETGESNLKEQQMWDDADYDGIISSLESKNSRTAQENLKLGNAYMNAANLSFTDLAIMISDTSNKASSNPNARAYSNESYAAFAQKIENNIKDNPLVLEYLQKAVESFSEVDDNTSLDENNVSVGTLIGAAQTAQATSAFSYLGDIAQLLNNGVDYELLASSCAIFHVYGFSDVQELNNPVENCLHTKILQNTDTQNNYKEMLVTLTNGEVYKRLITSNGKNVILTDGYLDAIGDKTSDGANGVYTPAMVQDESLTIQNALVMTLNEGFENILALTQEDIQDEILAFREEIDSDGDGLITAVEISAYINLQIQN